MNLKKIIREETDDLDWIREVPKGFGPNFIPRKGDVLICLPGFNAHYDGRKYKGEPYDPKCGGAGYEEGRIIVVDRVEAVDYPKGNEQIIIWPDGIRSKGYWYKNHPCETCGIYGRALNYYEEPLRESEEDDDLGWIRDTHDPLQPGLIYQTPNGNTLKIKKTNKTKVYYDLWDVEDNELYEIDALKYEFLSYVEGGIWVRVDRMANESLMESEDELDWIRDTYDIFHPGLVYQARTGSTIRITGTDDSRVYYDVWDVEQNVLWKNVSHPKKDVSWLIKGGIWVRVDRMANESLTESQEDDDWDWVNWSQPKSLTNLNDDDLHELYYIARKAELISQLISGNVYIKILNPEKQQDLEQMFFDMGYTKFDGKTNLRPHRGLNNYWAKGDYLVVYNNGVTDKVIDLIRKQDMDKRNIRKGSDFSLSLQ